MAGVEWWIGCKKVEFMGKGWSDALIIVELKCVNGGEIFSVQIGDVGWDGADWWIGCK